MNKTRLIFLALLMFLLALLAACIPTPTPDFGEQGTLQFDPKEFPGGKINQGYAVTITITGGSTPVGDIFLEEGNLPDGLILVKVKNEDKAILSGTPTKAGIFQFTIGAWCFGTQRAGDQGSKDYVVTVNP
jgi:hypothetical protein